MRPYVRENVGVPLYLLAVLVFGLGGLHAVLDDDPLYAELAEASILFVFGGAIAAIGYRLRRRGASLDAAFRITVFVLAGGLGVGLLAVLFVTVRLLTGVATPEFEFILFIGWSVGAAAGAWTGFYVVQLESALDDQRDVAKRLTVLQRVLRHNLRNEMTVIGGASRDLRNLVDDSEAADKVDTIVRHAGEVSRLSEQSGILTRIWQTEARATVDLQDVLRSEVDRFRRNHPDVPLSADVPDGVRIEAHPSVGLAFREGLENAVVHNEDVEVSLGVSERDARSVTVSVSDTGSGIPESEIRPLWAPGEAPLAHTTGLGLWLIYWLLEASDGELQVESDAGGSTLAMTFQRA